MNRLMQHSILIAIAVLSIVKLSAAESLENIAFVKLSPPEQKAVIKLPDGKLQMVGIGDMIGDENKIVEISKDRVVLERLTQHGVETIIVTLRAGKQQIQKLSKAAGNKQPIPGSSAQADKAR